MSVRYLEQIWVSLPRVEVRDEAREAYSMDSSTVLSGFFGILLPEETLFDKSNRMSGYRKGKSGL